MKVCTEWEPCKQYVEGQYVSCDGRIWQCHVAGTSGTSPLNSRWQAHADGTVLWLRTPLEALPSIDYGLDSGRCTKERCPMLVGGGIAHAPGCRRL